MTKHLILDIDGVVIQGRPVDGRPWFTSISEGTGISREEIVEYFFNPYWRDIVIGKMDFRKTLQVALDRCEVKVSIDDFIEYWFSNDAKINSKLLDVVADYKSKGVPVYLCTNQELERKKYLWNNSGLKNHFDGIFASADIGFAKPDIEYYQYVQKKLNIENASDCLFFDDRPDFVDGAIKAGWNAHVFTDVDDVSSKLKQYL